uniref:Uncharacterized protein n=1 Tax=Erythrolobus madagascarensis TaxID=708628 RepID=A0A7S0XME3_9RHOD|mmetsp:Transcript_2035/g.4496  ORF Transcript_2035/g.4496 Transcript_2035/m.4496 type:complete len:255 (+) Transcript_2035:309-1073(+)|eukprot:CAMPEP_0185845574 /NCGR_PEP_ID=MMETSP1354-20130828/1498_1 /TAXON_ID=708628 /ORGANISM="Erythrolobus madagascarensis, Strain CCMP3276" /LENGTH=254 /DNA_ID=CAMNT_0028545561 /DNA_START=305 /DNA_END=1069 /DNA_ORIENTATION=-
MMGKGGAVLVSEVVNAGLDGINSHYDEVEQFISSYGELDVDVCSSKAPQPEPRTFTDNTITVFDWDDTLLPSTFLAAMGLRVDDEYDLPGFVRLQLEELEVLTIGLIEAAMKKGGVMVITNAETGWVELSGARFMPRLLEFIQAQRIAVISARSTYEPEFPGNPSDWKIQAFTHEIGLQFPLMDGLNILSLGDGVSERDASHAVALTLPMSRVKTVKYIERPTIEQLQKQVSLVHSSFNELYQHDGSFDVNLAC